MTISNNVMVAGRGYICDLPDLTLHIIVTPEGKPGIWKATAYDKEAKLTVMEDWFGHPDDAKEHCQKWVNSFRLGEREPRFPALTAPLEWEPYGVPLREM